MARTDEQVATILREIYDAEFGGKARQRYLLQWSDIRIFYGFGRLTGSRFEALAEAAMRKKLYVLDLGEGESGHLVAVIKVRTVNRWRRVPKRIVEEYRLPPDDEGDADEDDSE